MFECDNCLIKFKSKYLLEKHKAKKVPCVKINKNVDDNVKSDKTTKDKTTKTTKTTKNKTTKDKPSKDKTTKDKTTKDKTTKDKRKIDKKKKVSETDKTTDNSEEKDNETSSNETQDEQQANENLKNDFEQELERNVELQELLKRILNDMAEDKLECVFCEGMFNKRHIHAHYAKDCKQITDDLKKYFINKCNLEHTYKADEKPPIYHIKTLKYAVLKQVFMDDTSSTDIITDDKLINISHNNRYIVQIE